MKRILFAVFAAAALFIGCNKEGGDTPLTADFKVSSNPCDAGDPIKFTAVVKGGKLPFTYEWKVGTDVTKTESEFTHVFRTNGTVFVSVTVKDAAGASATKKKTIVVNPAKVSETGNVTLNWVGYMEGYNTIASPAVADDGSVYAVTDKSVLYKFTNSGNLAWEKEVFTSSEKSAVTNFSNNRMNSTPSIDTDGTIYVLGGSINKLAKLVAFNPDGSTKWSFKDFWNKGKDHEASITGGSVAVGTDNVYFGNTGQTGTVFAVSKANGARKGFVLHTGGGPSGGVRSGVVISKAGYLHWYGGAYGLFGALQSGLDNAADGYDYAWKLYGSNSAPTSHSLIGAMSINGKSCVVGQVTDELSTKIYAADAETGDEVSCVRISDTADQDQGGVSVTAEGYIVASLNYTMGQDNGGVIIVDPVSSEIKARYRTQEKVSGSSAVDADGNIHFFTESGYYYVVKPDYNTGSCELKVKRDIATIIRQDSRYAEQYAEMEFAKFWCSAVIGDDGKVYCCFTDEFTRLFGGVVCVSFDGCTGPADSDWPMVGQNRRHTNAQK